MTVGDAPYLSIILTGRNDDFGGDFNGRFFRALRFNHDHLTAAGVSHEFVFVEWRPIAGRSYLATQLEQELPDLGPAELRCYVVDPAYHDAFSQNPRLQFQEFIAKNVGIRRTRGRHVLTTNTDVYLSRGIIDRLASRSLADGVLYRAARCDLKSAIDVSRLDWDSLEDERNYEIVNTIRPPFFTNASGDFLLLDRDSYHRLRGFNEVYRVAKIHIDGNFCLKAYFAGVTLTPLDAPIYHVGHGTLNSQMGLYVDRPWDAPWGNSRWSYEAVYVNDDNWGLGLAPTTPVRPGLHYLEFTWESVPSLVALGRVEVPSGVTTI